MTLQDFITKLQQIAEMVDAKRTDVQMADTLPVVDPVLKDGVVYITDEKQSDRKSSVQLMKNCKPAISRKNNIRN